MKKSAHPRKKAPHAKVDIRAQKAILEAELRLQNPQHEIPPDEFLTEITDLIQRFPCTEEDKHTLLDYHTGTWPTDADLKEEEAREREKLQSLPDTPEKAEFQRCIDDGSVVKQWHLVTSMKLEDRCRKIRQRLPATADTARFTALVQQAASTTLGVELGITTWRWSNKILQQHFEKTQDKGALGAVVGALETVRGPIEDPADIPERWVRRAAFTLASKGGRIPKVGSGKHRTTSDEKRRAQTRDRQRTFREAVRKAKEELAEEIQKARERISHSRRPMRNPRAELLKELIHILQAALQGEDSHRKKVAGENLKKLQQKLKT